MSFRALQPVKWGVVAGFGLVAVSLIGSVRPTHFDPRLIQSLGVTGAVIAASSLLSLRSQAKRSKILEPVIEYITDVEGNWDYFKRLVHRSCILSFDTTGRVLHLADHGHLVFGGDTFDKGPGDIRIAQALLRLKKQHPDRVTIILGNRDVNKLRMFSELQPGENGSKVDVYWDPKHKPYLKYCEENNLEVESAVSTCKWMLDCTMGSLLAFETRRTELALLRSCPRESVTDDAVVESYLSSVDPNGEDPWLLEFIRHGQLAAIVNDCLFVHGGFGLRQLGAVPGQKTNQTRSLTQWVKGLNEWLQGQLVEFCVSPSWTTIADGKRTRGGNQLMDYGLPRGADDRTVIYANWLHNGNCKEIEPEVEQILVTNQIRRVFTGHQPHGDCPSTIRTPVGVEIMMCDTSYSDMGADKSENPNNNRGIAVTVVAIRPSSTTVSGVLKDGTEHGFVLTKNDTTSIDSLVGRKLKDEWWVKTIVRESKKEPVVIVSKGEGFKINTKAMSEAEVLEALA